MITSQFELKIVLNNVFDAETLFNHFSSKIDELNNNTGLYIGYNYYPLFDAKIVMNDNIVYLNGNLRNCIIDDVVIYLYKYLDEICFVESFELKAFCEYEGICNLYKYDCNVENVILRKTLISNGFYKEYNSFVIHF